MPQFGDGIFRTVRQRQKDRHSNIDWPVITLNLRGAQMGEVIMQVTDVRVRRIEKEGKMKAIVSITLDNEFVIHDIKVIEGEKGLFIAMPSRKAADGEYRDIAHPINSGTRDMIQRVILDKYETTTLEEAQAV